MRTLWICLALLCGALPRAQEARLTCTPAVYPSAALGFHGPERWISARIVDGITGAPLSDAELFLARESEHPVPGGFWWQMHAAADADGFVRIRVDEGAPGYQAWNWMLLRAPGYGPKLFRGGAHTPVIPMARAWTIPVRIVDWSYRPVVGVHVGLSGGFGYAPDLARARTDAHGLALLSGVDPRYGVREIYTAHPALAYTYKSVHWFPGQAPAVFSVGPGVSSCGTLLDATGRPLSGAIVTTTEIRGPSTLTDANGAFVLYGSRSLADLVVRHGGRRVVFERPDRDPLILRMPEPGGQDGQFVSAWPELPSGPPPTPATHFVRVEGLPLGGKVYLNTRTTTREIDPSGPIGLPQEPACFVLTTGHWYGFQRRVFPLEEPKPPAGTVFHLPWYPPTRIEGRVVDGAGRPLPCTFALKFFFREFRGFDPDNDDELEAVSPTGERAGETFSLETGYEGLVLLVIRDAARSHRPRVLPLMLPARGDDVRVDLGTLVLGGPPRLVLLTASGQPLAKAEVGLLRPGWCDLIGAGAQFPLDADGVWRGPDPMAGDAILVAGDTRASTDPEFETVITLPARFVLSGAGAWTKRLPGAELLLDIRDETQAPVAAGVTLGDNFHEVLGPTLIRRVPPGAQRLFIGAEGYRSASAELVVPASGRVTLQERLRRR